jgi:hypothetical protein
MYISTLKTRLARLPVNVEATLKASKLPLMGTGNRGRLIRLCEDPKTSDTSDSSSKTNTTSEAFDDFWIVNGW